MKKKISIITVVFLVVLVTLIYIKLSVEQKIEQKLTNFSIPEVKISYKKVSVSPFDIFRTIHKATIHEITLEPIKQQPENPIKLKFKKATIAYKETKDTPLFISVEAYNGEIPLNNIDKPEVQFLLKKYGFKDHITIKKAKYIRTVEKSGDMETITELNMDKFFSLSTDVKIKKPSNNNMPTFLDLNYAKLVYQDQGMLKMLFDLVPPAYDTMKTFATSIAQSAETNQITDVVLIAKEFTTFLDDPGMILIEYKPKPENSITKKLIKAYYKNPLDQKLEEKIYNSIPEILKEIKIRFYKKS